MLLVLLQVRIYKFVHAATSDTDFLSDVKVVPSDKKVTDKTDDEKKVTDEDQSIGEGSDKDTKKSEKDNDNDDENSELDDKSNNDGNAETSKEENEKDFEVKSPEAIRASAKQTNASVSPTVPDKIKPDESKSQIEESDKQNQSNPDTSEEVENDAERPDEEESPEEGEVDEEGEKEGEESNDDLDKRLRMERSMDLAPDKRRRMQPLPGDSREEPAGKMEEIGKLKKSFVSVLIVISVIKAIIEYIKYQKSLN